jgi:hypothetical protein
MTILRRLLNFFRRDPWAPIPTLTDLNGPRLTRRMGCAIEDLRRLNEREARKKRLNQFLRLPDVVRRSHWENDEIEYSPRGEGNVKRTNNYDL